MTINHHYQTDWQQICPDSGSLPVRRRQRGVAARQLLLHHARSPQQEEGQGAKKVAVTIVGKSDFDYGILILGSIFPNFPEYFS